MAPSPSARSLSVATWLEWRESTLQVPVMHRQASAVAERHTKCLLLVSLPLRLSQSTMSSISGLALTAGAQSLKTIIELGSSLASKGELLETECA